MSSQRLPPTNRKLPVSCSCARLCSPIQTLSTAFALGSEEIQCAIALRPQISVAVAAALAEVGCAEACKLLVSNSGAKIVPISLRRLVERFGDRSDMRDLLMDDPRLPVDARQMLVVKVSQALSAMPMVKALIGSMRAERITREAVVRASLDLIDVTGPEEHPALWSICASPAHSIPACIACDGSRKDRFFFAAILAALSNEDESRIKAQLAAGRPAVLSALFGKCGFTAVISSIFGSRARLLRAVANGKLNAGSQEIARLLLEFAGADNKTPAFAHGNDDIVGLIRAIYLETSARKWSTSRSAIQAA